MIRIIRQIIVSALLAATGMGLTPAFGSGIPVIDAAAISNQLEQISYMVQQLQQMQQQVAALQAQVRAITGGRGMESLLSGQVRNYLPPEWNEAMNVLSQGNQAYQQLADNIRQIKQAQAVLKDADLNRLTPELRRMLEDARTAAATQQALGEAAYRQASQRVALLQQLTDTISAADDAKAVMDLQARIQSEQTMLTNDMIKLQALSQLQQTEDRAREQQDRERAIKRSGSSASTIPSLLN